MAKGNCSTKPIDSISGESICYNLYSVLSNVPQHLDILSCASRVFGPLFPQYKVISWTYRIECQCITFSAVTVTDSCTSSLILSCIVCYPVNLIAGVRLCVHIYVFLLFFCCVFHYFEYLTSLLNLFLVSCSFHSIPWYSYFLHFTFL